MKKILFLLLLPAMMQAQTTLIDSTWIINSGGKFFEKHLVKWDNGEDILTTSNLGDTNTVALSFVSRFTSKANEWAQQAQQASSHRRQIGEIIRQSAYLNTTIGRNPLKMIADADKSVLLDSLNRIRELGSTSKTIKFTQLSNGQMRYKVDTFATRNAYVVGNVIRLSNYLNAGRDLDIFKFNGNRYWSLGRDVQIYPLASGPATAAVEGEWIGNTRCKENQPNDFRY